MTPKQVDKETKRKQIYQAGMELFAQKGVVGTTIQEIADRAGVGKGTVYEYFNSKEDILAASFQFMQSEMEQTLKRELEGVETPREKLQSVFQGMAGYLDNLPEGVAEILLVFWAEGILQNPNDDPYTQFDLKAMYENYTGWVEAIIDEGKEVGVFRTDISSQELASILVGVMDGLMLQWVLFRDRIELDRVSRTMMDAIYTGILTDDSEG